MNFSIASKSERWGKGRTSATQKTTDEEKVPQMKCRGGGEKKTMGRSQGGGPVWFSKHQRKRYGGIWKNLIRDHEDFLGGEEGRT